MFVEFSHLQGLRSLYFIKNNSDKYNSCLYDILLPIRKLCYAKLQTKRIKDCIALYKSINSGPRFLASGQKRQYGSDIASIENFLK